MKHRRVNEMSVDNCIITIKKELILKHPLLEKKYLKAKTNERQLELLKRVHLIVGKVIKSIADGFPPVFDSISAKWENCIFDKKVTFKETPKKIKHIDFKKRRSRSDFAIIVFLLSKIHKLLLTRQTSTRRWLHKYIGSTELALYYENLGIFKSQKKVDCVMRDVCYLLNAPSWELRVLATSKGIVAGPVVLTMANGESVNCDKQGGVCIPQNIFEIKEISSSATWVLVVEKDASFQKLINNEASRKLGSCILITGKGFPDLNSRILVRKFWEVLQIPVLVLVDADPYGFEIMCIYRFGSLSMSPYSKDLACPAIRWLGVHPSDIRPLLLDSRVLSPKDARKIHCLLKRPYIKKNESLKSQLEILLEENVKAEIEGVASISTNYLTDVYVKNKIKCKEYL